MAYTLKNFVADHNWQKLDRFYYKQVGDVVVSLSQRNRYFDMFFSCNLDEEKQMAVKKELASLAEKYFIFDVVCVDEGVQVVFRKTEVGLDSNYEYKVATPFDQIANAIAQIVANHTQKCCGLCHQQVGKGTLVALAWGVAYCCDKCKEELAQLLPEQVQPNLFRAWTKQLIGVAIGLALYLFFQCISKTNSRIVLYFMAYVGLSVGVLAGQLIFDKLTLTGLVHPAHRWWMPVATTFVGFLLVDIILFPFMATCWGWGGTNIGFLYKSYFVDFFLQNTLFALLFCFTGWLAFHAFDVLLNEYSEYYAKKYIKYMDKKREEIKNAQHPEEEHLD
ncbi:MAG: hypothetical protein IJF72_01525 [Clostridia bacterium]|nr:hypothetical protein [Clostridia bacterium]